MFSTGFFHFLPEGTYFEIPLKYSEKNALHTQDECGKVFVK
jgi:hypothetical protein